MKLALTTKKRAESSSQPNKHGFDLFSPFIRECSEGLRIFLDSCRSKKSWTRFILELSFAISTCVAYYFLILPYAVGTPNNSTNFWVFGTCSSPNFHLFQVGDVWKGRLAGTLFTGFLFDSMLNSNGINIEQYSRVAAFYQSLWLFVLFLTVIVGLRNSLLINLGIFAGLIYNFSPISGLYIYPWDIPSTLFFTLAILFFERRQFLQMLVAMIVGCFFKETVLTCALLILFIDQWKWWKRILVFAIVAALYALGKRMLLSLLHFESASFSMGNASNLATLFNFRIFNQNIEYIFTPTMNSVFFVNTGTVVAILLFGWQRRFLPYMLVALCFLAGQLMYGAYKEVRIFMQILPLSMIILAEQWLNYNWPAVAYKDTPVSRQSSKSTLSLARWSVRRTFPILTLLTIFLVIVSIAIPARQFHLILQTIQNQYDNHARFVEDLKSKSARGDGSASIALGGIYREGQWVKSDKVEAYKWYKLAQLQGASGAESEMTNTANAYLTQEQVKAAEEEVRQSQHGRQ